MFDYFRNYYNSIKILSNVHQVCCEDSLTKGAYNLFSVRWPWLSFKVTSKDGMTVSLCFDHLDLDARSQWIGTGKKFSADLSQNYKANNKHSTCYKGWSYFIIMILTLKTFLYGLITLLNLEADLLQWLPLSTCCWFFFQFRAFLWCSCCCSWAALSLQQPSPWWCSAHNAPAPTAVLATTVS